MRLPLEGLVLIAVAIVLPATARRLLAGVVGPLLALVVILKILDIGFFATFDRPFDPYQDLSYAGIGSETLRKLDRCAKREPGHRWVGGARGRAYSSS